jgi:NAD(P) transhydrogenase
MPNYDYDILIIGSGPAGKSAAIQSAKLGKTVAVVERSDVIGGVMLNTGTIPSKTLREAAMYLTGYREREVYGESFTVKQSISIKDLLVRTSHVMDNEVDVTRHQMLRNGVELITADASFVDPHTMSLTEPNGRVREVKAAKVLIAVGTTATGSDQVAVDGKRIFLSDDILDLDRLPRTLSIVGAGVIGVEYASIFATLGIRVTLIDQNTAMLPFIDAEIMASLTYHLRSSRVTLRLGEKVSAIEPFDDDRGEHVRIELESGKRIVSEKALYCVGRTGSTDTLNLAAAGLRADERGRIAVDPHYGTGVPHIFAAGDVIGFPSLASTSSEQGRVAASNAFGIESRSVPQLFPFGIYTIPEISMVGNNEEELTRAEVPYEVGKAQYKEIARGQILGDQTGMLKLIFHLESRKLLGVHIIGEGATELVHIGQAVLAHGGTVDYFVDTVFNYPTLAEAYKTAAFDWINRVGA